MIKHSSPEKWDRLAQKQLNHQFINEISVGLQCSPFEANAILETVYQVYAPYFETTGSLKPGQMWFQVISVEESAATHLKNSKQTTVILTLDAGEEDLEIRKHRGIVELRQHRMQRVCIEAFQQGGLLTIEDLAYRLFNCGERTLSRDLEALRKNRIVLPLRSTIKDMGRSLSHRVMIVEEWLRGKEYTEIAQKTHHSVSAVRNYVDKLKRIVALAEEGFEVHAIAFLVKASATLVEEYHRLYHDLAPAMAHHRKEEIPSFLKKTFVPSQNEQKSNDSDA